MSELNYLFVILQFLTLAIGSAAFKHLSDALRNSHNLLEKETTISMPNFDELKAEIGEIMEDIVHDTLQTLQPPRAVDHVFGAVAQLIQARTMKMMDAAPMIAETAKELFNEQENV